nr:hypothetical protein GCM10020093_005640 [Planobispora longispora]
MPGDRGGARGGAQQGGQHAHGRRLARAVGAEETHDLTGFDGQIHARDGPDAALEGLAQTRCLDHFIASIFTVTLIFK